MSDELGPVSHPRSGRRGTYEPPRQHIPEEFRRRAPGVLTLSKVAARQPVSRLRQLLRVLLRRDRQGRRSIPPDRMDGTDCKVTAGPRRIYHSEMMAGGSIR